MFEGFFGRMRSALYAKQATSQVTPVAVRPVIGLALSGGAARGLAHIGVLRTLLANGVVPDVIVGTSIGALVGGCYAADRLDSLESWARSLTVRRMLGYLDVGLSGSGLIQGNLLAHELKAALADRCIEDLPIQFAAIATEFNTGREIWLTRGSLVNALRASYALPGIFPPVLIGDRWLVDGALVNPIPVLAARALGARLVIAVNANSDLVGHGAIIASQEIDEEDNTLNTAKAKIHGFRAIFSHGLVRRKLMSRHGYPGIAAVMIEALNVMQDRVTRARLAVDPPDILINPGLSAVSWYEFYRSAEVIRIGIEAAEKSIDTITEMIAALAYAHNGNKVGDSRYIGRLLDDGNLILDMPKSSLNLQGPMPNQTLHGSISNRAAASM